MKVKASKKEIRECVEGAIFRVIKEGKYGEPEYKKKTPKHGKLQPTSKKGGNKGNHRINFDEEDY